MPNQPHVLVVCGKNKRRSRTAECIFKNDARFRIRSVGLSPRSERKLSEPDLHWADLVLTMETDHRQKITGLYAHLTLPPVAVLHIADDYDFMDEELIQLLTERIDDHLRERYGL